MGGEYGCGGRRGSLSIRSLTGWLCLVSSPAGPSAWFVCGGLMVPGRIKGPACFFALFLMNALLFFSAPPQVPASRIPSFRPIQGKCKHYTIMTSGEHSNGITPVSELNLERWGIMECWLDCEWKSVKKKKKWSVVGELIPKGNCRPISIKWIFDALLIKS